MKRFSVILSVTVLMFLAACGSGGDVGTFKVYGAPTVADIVNPNSAEYGSPTYFQVKFYAMWVGSTADCANLTLVQDFATDGKTVDMFDNPTIFTGMPADGTYNCMVIKMSDTMTFKPEKTYDVCTAGQEYSFDIAWDDTAQWVDNNFQPITQGIGENTVYLFVSTDYSQAVAKGASVQQCITLQNPMTVPGHVNMVIDSTNKIYKHEQFGTCWIDQPTISFQ